ncbi:hypothetical protein K474DRAFT_1676184 [Panus rudis PR-1116 ss-1]|nr:hypothetical protein K474DRAFT_1676184 [Panus rudis PR-1116 ss-1]
MPGGFSRCNDKHILIFDNAPTHVARAPDSLSAQHMSKNPTQPQHQMFGVDVPVLENGKAVCDRTGKVIKQRVRMVDGKFADGTPQSLYYPAGHPQEGVFKGMANILHERGYTNAHKLRYECSKFKCPPWNPKNPCCCRRLLYNEPDFVNVESLLQSHCRERGFDTIFLPKFHCELNPIEQCWGAAKREYRKFPMSSAKDDLARNVTLALDMVSLKQIRRFTDRSLRFMDAYRRGLTGRQATWACKKYRGHPRSTQVGLGLWSSVIWAYLSEKMQTVQRDIRSHRDVERDRSEESVNKLQVRITSEVVVEG